MDEIMQKWCMSIAVSFTPWLEADCCGCSHLGGEEEPPEMAVWLKYLKFSSK